MLPRKTNYQAFTPEKREQCLKFIGVLMEMNQEIRISNDGYCTVVEWIDNTAEDDMERFAFLDYDMGTYTAVKLPDRSYVNVFDFENKTEDEVINEWLKDNPRWKKGTFGWYQEDGDADASEMNIRDE